MTTAFEPDLLHLLLTTVFAFLVGLEIKSYRTLRAQERDEPIFGTARTYAFVGILGFFLYRLDPESMMLYLAGFGALTLLFALFYARRLKHGRGSILLYLVMVCVYLLGPLTQRYSIWMPALLFVLVVTILNAKPAIDRILKGLNPYEFETLSKMVLLSAVILPLLPDEKVIPHVPLSPFKIWLAVVVISAISYGGYLMQRYLFPGKGFFLTGIIGGTYSSTATTVVLARKARTQGANGMIDAGIVAATAVMYLRLIAVAFIFNPAIGKALLAPFTALSAVGMGLALALYRRAGARQGKTEIHDRSPLELGTAFLFAALFVVMMVLTQYVTAHFGQKGLELLSFVVGLTDIDPFVLSLLTGEYHVTGVQITAAIMIAAGSNNLLKAAYALWFGGWRGGGRAAALIVSLGVATILWALWLEHLI